VNLRPLEMGNQRESIPPQRGGIFACFGKSAILQLWGRMNESHESECESKLTDPAHVGGGPKPWARVPMFKVGAETKSKGQSNYK